MSASKHSYEAAPPADGHTAFAVAINLGGAASLTVRVDARSINELVEVLQAHVAEHKPIVSPHLVNPAQAIVIVAGPSTMFVVLGTWEEQVAIAKAQAARQAEIAKQHARPDQRVVIPGQRPPLPVRGR